MFCLQSQETFGCKGCTVQGVCGKTPEGSALQDLLVYATKGIASVTTQLRSEAIPWRVILITEPTLLRRRMKLRRHFLQEEANTERGSAEVYYKSSPQKWIKIRTFEGELPDEMRVLCVMQGAFQQRFGRNSTKSRNES